LFVVDLGPWDKHKTVTNDIDRVLNELYRQGKLVNGRRLFYRDSEGNQDEVLHKDGFFEGFGSEVHGIDSL